MGARNVSTAFATALAGAHVNLFLLVEIGWSSGTQYLCGLYTLSLPDRYRVHRAHWLRSTAFFA